MLNKLTLAERRAWSSPLTPLGSRQQRHPQISIALSSGGYSHGYSDPSGAGADRLQDDLAGAPDQNEAFTHWQNLDWATEHSMMVCRRNEIQLFDPVEGMRLSPVDDPAPPLNPNFADFGQCARAGIRLAMDWDDGHRNTPWRVWRVGCPSPIVDMRTGSAHRL